MPVAVCSSYVFLCVPPPAGATDRLGYIRDTTASRFRFSCFACGVVVHACDPSLLRDLNC